MDKDTAVTILACAENLCVSWQAKVLFKQCHIALVNDFDVGSTDFPRFETAFECLVEIVDSQARKDALKSMCTAILDKVKMSDVKRKRKTYSRLRLVPVDKPKRPRRKSKKHKKSKRSRRR
jgi:hypothetical protein